ncbi:type I restriction endonuclease subunit R [Corynebacterium aquatimens]|uniref:Type I restriction enzyme endonuclease subunit n=1 Tax=Corynebacterium aquatimens TaxID=1190508 RepID=A0A931GS86_9CORY|nr:type I restriction endonuclease subunit R [Corynebacterium aquatimens]MBG6121797.1 type I restriction enzyme R subunit [Corynebacterium aquatimens]WJY65664.1 Type I restriction enzyme R protein [Corynebacterium aquatimens]
MAQFSNPSRSFSPRPQHDYLDPVAVTDTSTVIANYEADGNSATGYQSEAALEDALIKQLQRQAYDYADIRDAQSMRDNVRTQLEKLNNYQFSDTEWETFYRTEIANPSSGIVEKTRTIQTDHVKNLIRDDGTTKNIALIDKDNIHRNSLQVINQYSTKKSEKGNESNRYDVSILVNGLPLVHLELKRRGVAIRQAFNQIDRYQRDSFWADEGLFQYVQLFVISNGTQTKYYSNTTRDLHIKDQTKKSSQQSRKRKTSNSFEFTSWWADAKNKPITDLMAFATTFLSKHTLLAVLTRYCVFTVDELLLVMRPYQIAAAERILNRIERSISYKQLGSVNGGGYVWHTTGSGKTLTSFKTAQLATENESVEKVIFVVDRKDLDYQTIREYDRFEKGAANSNTSTKILSQQLSTKSELLAEIEQREREGKPTGDIDLTRADSKIVITTIQKMSHFIAGNDKREIYNQHVVFIFDECHRSQFGSMHTAIKKKFKKANFFGFTGTPIFEQNKVGSNPNLQTTTQAFGDMLHSYTIVDAIRDKNVLPFKVEYHELSPVSPDPNSPFELTAAELLVPGRIEEITGYTLEHFDQKTKRDLGQSYTHKVVTNVEQSVRKRGAKEATKADRKVKGFNALFATDSIQAARTYYDEFTRQQASLPLDQRLKVATIFSAQSNVNDAVDLIEDEDFDTSKLSGDNLDFLARAVGDYNEMFATNYDARDAESFENYYKDLSQRIKNRDIDLVIVVNMLLTGFDATTLNTLFVDKNLRMHGLIQAFSRTNRILNSVKTYGNIVSFRDLDKNTNEALELFGNADNAAQVAILAPFKDFYRDYSRKVEDLKDFYPSGQVIASESGQKAFVKLYGEVLKLENVLTSFDEFAGQELLSERESQDYKSMYLDLHDEFKAQRIADMPFDETGDDEADEQLVFELELIKQVEINVDYIVMLIDEYRKQHGTGDTEGAQQTRETIERSVDASPSLRDKRDLIEEFMDTVGEGDHALETSDMSTDQRWVQFIAVRRDEELKNLIETERLKPEATYTFVERALESGVVPTSGTALTKLLPKTSRFGKQANHDEVRARVSDKLSAFVERFSLVI